MFTPIHQLTQFSAAEARKSEDRWHSREGRETFDMVMGLIRNGAGEDFLQSDFERGNLPILEDMWDLKGIHFGGEKLEFPRVIILKPSTSRMLI